MLEVLKRFRLQSQRGISIVTILVTMLIVAIGITAVTGGLTSLLKIKANMSAQMNVSHYRNRVVASLTSAEGASRTAAANTAMACLQSLTDCASYRSAETPIQVVSPDGTVLADPARPNVGFTPYGEPCSTFDATRGRDECPFRFEVTWKPICPPSGACIAPQNKFSGNLIFSGTKLSEPNLSKYNFQFFPAKMDSTLSEHCGTVNGTFDSSSRTCRLPMEGICPNNQIVVRLDANNQKYCAPIYFGVCPSGSAIEAIQADGSLVCKAITFCPAITRFGTWDPWIPAPGDFGSGGGDGCDGTDGCDGGS